MNDYASAAEFVMMHESIAAMLGVRRVGVTEAASRLQAAGLIAYARPHKSARQSGPAQEVLRVLSVIRQQYAGLHEGLSRLLSRA
jgi:Mn-dependent DtxR family transcriptional regulator